MLSKCSLVILKLLFQTNIESNKAPFSPLKSLIISACWFLKKKLSPYEKKCDNLLIEIPPPSGNSQIIFLQNDSVNIVHSDFLFG